MRKTLRRLWDEVKEVIVAIAVAVVVILAITLPVKSYVDSLRLENEAICENRGYLPAEYDRRLVPTRCLYIVDGEIKSVSVEDLK